MKERTGLTTFHGNPLTLLGPALKVGDAAPEATVADTKLQDVQLSSFAGRVRIISAVPSLDTSVCSIETRRFEQEAAKLGPEVVMLAISMDLPFAQKRWADESSIKETHLLSDYKQRSFGLAYGVLIKELGLLARTVFVVDQNDTIRHIQIVPEVTNEPDYDAVLDAARQATAALR